VFGTWQELDVLLFTTAFRPALGPTQPPIQWVPGALSLRVNRPGVKLTHLLVPRSGLRGAVPPLLQYAFMAGWLIKHRDNFTFTFYLFFNQLKTCFLCLNFFGHHVISLNVSHEPHLRNMNSIRIIFSPKPNTIVIKNGRSTIIFSYVCPTWGSTHSSVTCDQEGNYS
jgi:hypothetical protein